jgi:hypothetical protein
METLNEKHVVAKVLRDRAVADVTVQGLANLSVHEGRHLGLEEILNGLDGSLNLEELAKVSDLNVLM